MLWTTIANFHHTSSTAYVERIALKAASSEQMPEAFREVTEVLRKEHDLPQSEENDFNIVDPVKSRDEMELATRETVKIAKEPVNWDKELKEAHARDIASLGDNIFVIWQNDERSLVGQPSPASLTPQDAEAIAKQCSAVLAAAPVYKGPSVVIAFKKRRWSSRDFLGTTPSYLAIRDWQKLKEGSFFSDQDVRNAEAVCVIGQTVSKKLFGEAAPLNRQIQIDGHPFRVVGVLEKRGGDSQGRDQDDTILTPWTTIDKLFRASDANNATRADAIWIKVASKEKMAKATDQITHVLREQHHLSKSDKDDFLILDLIKSHDEWMELMREDAQQSHSTTGR